MLKKIPNLPADVLGIRAEGKVTPDDYESVLMPLLEEVRTKGQRVRFLYQLGNDFDRLTPGAAWDDARVGVKYIRLFERCAVVSDVSWLRTAVEIFAPLLPCPSKVFGNDEMAKAVDWLSSPAHVSQLDFELGANGVLVVRPQGPLQREDFDRLAEVVDPWIEAHGKLKGVAIGVKKFPGWENFGALIRHISFVKDHQREVRRVALAVDGALPDLMAKLGAHFVQAEIQAFPAAEMSKAIEWVGHA